MSEHDVVQWFPDKLLEWSDFKADANPAEFQDAYSAIRYRPHWTVGSVYVNAEQQHYTNEQGFGNDSETFDNFAVPYAQDKERTVGEIFFVITRLDIATEFWSCLSWARPDCNDAELNHQQGHFDLGEIVMRKEIDGIRDHLYKKYFPTRGKNEEQRKQFAKNDSALVIEPIIHKLGESLEKMRLDYDSETTFGCNTDVQSKYDKMFATLKK